MRTADQITEAGSADLAERVKAVTAQIQEYYCADGVPWVVGYSGGKDSTTVLQLIWRALAALPAEHRQKPVHVITTDTLVEQPIVAAWVKNSMERIELAAREQKLPFEAHLLHPPFDQTFWVNLIGRGYPAPRPQFRWCTDRLKIQPSNQFITELVRRSGETIVCIGTRKAESRARAGAMNRRESGRLRDGLSPNPSLPNSLLFSPIEDWSNNEVWMYLMQVANPWGHSNRDLVTMYKGASADSECPLVIDKSTPTCGNSRFGCWVCTMVERDRSMEAMIQNDEEKEWMLPLLELRNEMDLRDDKHLRDFRRMNGRVQLFNGEPIHGPYTKKTREHWLRRVLETQTLVREDGPEHVRNIELIRMEELREIRRLWVNEKYEFDDSLPGIYAQVTGEPFPQSDERDELLGADEWELLREVCGEDELLFDLSTHLLGREREYRAMSRRIGIYTALETTLNTRGYLTKEEAIEAARLRVEPAPSAADPLILPEEPS
jgi:DNA sulfur modification protein DndC